MSIKALIVDDSALMRKLIRDILTSDPTIEVVDIAHDGREAIEKTLKFKPDVITMDVEMPNMNGIEAVKHIMSSNPTPIVMLSALTSKDADVTIEALNSGAVDFICKPSGSISTDLAKIGEEIKAKVKSAAQAKVHRIDQITRPIPGSKIRVLLVDDSSLIRKMIKEFINRETDMIVAEEASNGKEAIERVENNPPDVIIMDIEMPMVDGVTATFEVLKRHDIPIIIFSGRAGTDIENIKLALEVGATDFIPKPAPNTPMYTVAPLLTKKIRDAYHEKRQNLTKKKTKTDTGCVLCIGASTGGPQTLAQLIPQLPSDIPSPVLIVQHMPPVFTRSLAERLNSISQIPVKEAKEGDELKPGEALLAPGDYHMVISEKRTNGNIKHVIKLNQEERIHGVRPAVDVTFSSAASTFGSHTVGVLLTGMGQDGATAMGLIKAKGGYTIAQDEKTSIIFGMPAAAIKLGVVDEVLPLDMIALHAVKALNKICKKAG
ncbi:MAG: chemotaxis-specific protein-glutamate methyltransferase CheB [Candidatus Thermoplasmatota archaeon]